jgi:hypothetical protein
LFSIAVRNDAPQRQEEREEANSELPEGPERLRDETGRGQEKRPVRLLSLLLSCLFLSEFLWYLW